MLYLHKNNFPHPESALHLKPINLSFFSRDASTGMLVAEVIQPLLSVVEPNAPQESDTDCVEKREEQMGIFQIIDKLE